MTQQEQMTAVVADLRARLAAARSKLGSEWTFFGIGAGSVAADIYGLTQIENRINVQASTSRDRVNAGTLSFETWMSYAGEINRTIALHDSDASQWAWSSAVAEIGVNAATDLRAGIIKAANLTPYVALIIAAVAALYLFGGKRA